MAYGFQPVRHAGGGVIRPNNFMSYKIADDYATALFRGDPVILVNDGTIARAVGTEGTPSTDTLVGVFWGVEYVPDTGAYAGRPVYDSTWPAAQSVEGSYANALVLDDPNIIFRIEADQVGTALTQAAVFAAMDFTVAAGSALTKVSGTYLDSSGTVGTSGQVRILNSGETDGTWTAAGTAMDVLVMIDEGFWVSRPAAV